MCNESHAVATIPSRERTGSHCAADTNITIRRRPPLNHAAARSRFRNDS
jgi:hypothetical protein